jgi:DNA-binding HxlR family transcriptional regulator
VTAHGQFCSIARSLDVLGQRWSLLVVREVLAGSHRFGDIRRGIPRISRTMLSARLRELVDLGVLAREPGRSYDLTPAGRELETIVRDLGVWGSAGCRGRCRAWSSTPTRCCGTCIAGCAATRCRRSPS